MIRLGGNLLLIVQKYGGTSVADKKRIMNAASRIAEAYRSGNRLVVVVSAQGSTTDELIKSAEDIDPDASGRELDMLLSTGEQQSAALMAMALKKMGLPAISLNGWQMGIVTTENHGNARIESIVTDRIENELNAGNIVIAAGFQGINEKGDITTLGRGGSDTTAVALAAALKAERCEIYTDVEGVYTADPRVVSTAEKLDSISYDEMLDFTTMGAKVLHNRSVELAKRHNVPLCVRSSFVRSDGTDVCAEDGARVVSGITSDENTALITITGMENQPGSAYGVFRLMADRGISVDIILGSGENDGEMAFTIEKSNLKAAASALKTNLRSGTIKWDDNFSKISVIGTGLESNPGVVSEIFAALAGEKINIEMITTSEIKISLLIERRDTDRAVKALHQGHVEDGK